MEAVGLIFLLLVIFQIKHLLCDFVLQGLYMVIGKGKNGTDWILPLLAHVGVHAAFTFTISNCVFLIYGLDLFALAFEIALFDAAVHFAMDRLKAGKQYLGRYEMRNAEDCEFHSAYLAQELASGGYPNDQPQLQKTWRANVADSSTQLQENTYFWWSLALDQAVHHLTGFACIYFILKTIQAIP